LHTFPFYHVLTAGEGSEKVKEVKQNEEEEVKKMKRRMMMMMITMMTTTTTPAAVVVVVVIKLLQRCFCHIHKHHYLKKIHIPERYG
jgi:uncharacterized membrane protein (DUF106 family)